MNFKEKIEGDFKKALRERDRKKSNVLSLLKSSIRNAEIAKRKDSLKDQEVQEVIAQEIKKRKDAVEQFKKGRREDLVKSEEEEIKILEKYMPEQFSNDEIRKIVEETINKIKAKKLSDFGKVMGSVMSRLKGRADGSRVSQIVREILNKNHG